MRDELVWLRVMYKSTDKICDLMSREEDAIHVISRFGLTMGVGEQTIAEACEVNGVHTPTFLGFSIALFAPCIDRGDYSRRSKFKDTDADIALLR